MEDAFYKGELRLNGEKLWKKSRTVRHYTSGQVVLHAAPSVLGADPGLLAAPDTGGQRPPSQRPSLSCHTGGSHHTPATYFFGTGDRTLNLTVARQVLVH